MWQLPRATESEKDVLLASFCMLKWLFGLDARAELSATSIRTDLSTSVLARVVRQLEGCIWGPWPAEASGKSGKVSVLSLSSLFKSNEANEPLGFGHGKCSQLCSQGVMQRQGR